MNIVQPIRDKRQIEAMKKELSPRDSFLFTLGINVGCRISDLLQLKVNDVRGKNLLSIVEGKTKKTKRFPLNKKLQVIIKKYTAGMDNEAWLFPSRKGNSHISSVQAYRILNETAKDLGIEEIGTHSLRKTFGYWHYQTHKDVALLQYLFNHSTPTVTLRYIGIVEENAFKSLEDFIL